MYLILSTECIFNLPGLLWMRHCTRWIGLPNSIYRNSNYFKHFLFVFAFSFIHLFVFVFVFAPLIKALCGDVAADDKLYLFCSDLLKEASDSTGLSKYYLCFLSSPSEQSIQKQIKRCYRTIKRKSFPKLFIRTT